MEAYFTLLFFVAVLVGTPGPANLLLMLGGAQIGVRACIPFIIGLVIGKLLLNIAMGLGFALFLGDAPVMQLVLKWVGASYMIWLATQSWNSAKSADGSVRYSFFRALWVHPLNPKAHVMSFVAWSSFAPQINGVFYQWASVLGSFLLVQMVLHSLWCFLGQLSGNAIKNNPILNKSLIIITVGVVLLALFY